MAGGGGSAVALPRVVRLGDMLALGVGLLLLGRVAQCSVVVSMPDVDLRLSSEVARCISRDPSGSRRRGVGKKHGFSSVGRTGDLRECQAMPCLIG